MYYVFKNLLDHIDIFCHYPSAAFEIYFVVSMQKMNACITPENQSK